FKVVKCRYKDFLKPAKQAELDSVRRNVREEIRDAIREQIRKAAPELGDSLSMERDILSERMNGSA
ncbi:outer membrane assembly protein, partial [gut metagenome]